MTSDWVWSLRAAIAGALRIGSPITSSPRPPTLNAPGFYHVFSIGFIVAREIFIARSVELLRGSLRSAWYICGERVHSPRAYLVPAAAERNRNAKGCET